MTRIDAVCYQTSFNQKTYFRKQVVTDAKVEIAKMVSAWGGYRGRMGGPGCGAGAGQHVVINDPNRLVPVQITIPGHMLQIGGATRSRSSPR